MRHYHVEHGDFRLYWNLVDFTNTRTKMTCKMLGRGFSGALSVWWRPWFGYAYRWFGRALLRRSWFTKVYKFIQGNPIFDSWYCRGISNLVNHWTISECHGAAHFDASAEDNGSCFRQDVTLNLCLGLEFTGAGLQFCGMSGAGDHRKHRHSYFHRKAGGMFWWKVHTKHNEKKTSKTLKAAFYHYLAQFVREVWQVSSAEILIEMETCLGRGFLYWVRWIPNFQHPPTLANKPAYCDILRDTASCILVVVDTEQMTSSASANQFSAKLWVM